MRALITGVGGFAGRFLAEHLASTTGWELWGTVRPGSGARDQGFAAEFNLQLAPLDVTEAAAVRALLADVKPDYVFHLAAQANVQQAFADPEATLVNNLVGALRVLEALRDQNLAATVLMIGSGEEYGHVYPEDLPVDEDTPFRPENPYAVSKVAQDMLALQYFLAFKQRIIRVRPFNHIGPGQSEHFVSSAFARQVAMIEAGLQEPVVRVGNLSAERDFTDVRDMVRAYHMAITECEPGEAYNLGSGRAVPVQKLLDILLELSDVPVTVEQDPKRMRPVDVPCIVCDATRFRTRTGWQPEVPLRRSLADILDFWRERVKSDAPLKEQR